MLHLLRHDEPLTVETDWFSLIEARTQLRPYTDPHPEVVVAATMSPSGAQLAGQHGVGHALDRGDGGRRHGDRALGDRPTGGGGRRDVGRPLAWRLVGPMHLAATREQAIEDVRYGLDHWFDYFQQVAAAPQLLPPGATFDERIEFINASGLGVIGTVDDAIDHLERLQAQVGGFGAYLLFAHEWAEPRATWDSFERLSRFVDAGPAGVDAGAVRGRDSSEGRARGAVRGAESGARGGDVAVRVRIGRNPWRERARR